MEKPPRILVTRAPHQASALADHLRALGAEPILIPTIDIVDPTSFDALDSSIRVHTTLPLAGGHRNRHYRSPGFECFIFTSANAAQAFNRRLIHLNHDIFSELNAHPLPGNCPRIAAIGPATRDALKDIGLHTDLIPPKAVAESLAESLLPFAIQPNGQPNRFLLIRAQEARDHIPMILRAAGAEVTVAPAYRTVMPANSIEALRKLFTAAGSAPDAITFTSASTVTNFFALAKAADVNFSAVKATDGKSPTQKDIVILSKAQDLLLEDAHQPGKPIFASIGPITSAALHELGYPPEVEAPEATVASLAESLVKYLALRKTR